MQGIYKLTNSLDERVYVGMSKDIDNRFKTHINDLKNNRHHAYKLQEFYNKHKHLKDFKVDYIVLEEVDDEKILFARENYYINTLNSYHNGFNSISGDGSPTATAKKDKINKKMDKYNIEKEIFDKLIKKYKTNIRYNRHNFSKQYLYRVNAMIQFFIKNYNMDSYYAEIKQYKSVVTMDVYHIHSSPSWIKRFTYSTKYKIVKLDHEVQKYIHWKKENYKTANEANNVSETIMRDLDKIKRKYIWLMKRLVIFDENIIKYNRLQYEDNKYEIPFSVIKEIVGYKGKNFKSQIIDDAEILKISKKLGLKYIRGAVIVHKIY